MAQPDWDRKTDKFIPGTSPSEKWDDFVRLRKIDDKAAKRLLENKGQVESKDWDSFVEEIVKLKSLKDLYPATDFERQRHSCRIVRKEDPSQYEGCKDGGGTAMLGVLLRLRELSQGPNEGYNPNKKS